MFLHDADQTSSALRERRLLSHLPVTTESEDRFLIRLISNHPDALGARIPSRAKMTDYPNERCAYGRRQLHLIEYIS